MVFESSTLPVKSVFRNIFVLLSSFYGLGILVKLCKCSSCVENYQKYCSLLKDLVPVFINK
jgi:hypothetical protein